MKQKVTVALVEKYLAYLQSEERAVATIQKYRYELMGFCRAVKGVPLCKDEVLNYKKQMLQARTAVTVNVALAAINGMLGWLGRQDCRVSLVRVQHSAYRDPKLELTRDEYYRLLAAAKKRNDERLYGILQTICATGIRVSELKFITVKAAKSGVATVYNKGKNRTVLLCRELQKWLLGFCRRRGITAGAVFTTRSGSPLDRSSIWAMMKALCGTAGVARRKVYPHNLRHLFASVFYQQEHDLEHLASLLGHSSVNTTRIYVQTNVSEHRRQIDRLHLVL